MFILYKIEKNQKGKNCSFIGGNGDLFFAINNTSNLKIIFFAAETDANGKDVFKIAKVGYYNNPNEECFKNKVIEFLPRKSLGNNFHAGQYHGQFSSIADVLFDFEEISSSQTMDDLKIPDEYELVLFEEYEPEPKNMEIVFEDNAECGKTVLLDIFEKLNFRRIQSVNLTNSFYSYESIELRVSDNETLEYSDVAYASNDFFDYLKKYFHSSNEYYSSNIWRNRGICNDYCTKCVYFECIDNSIRVQKFEFKFLLKDDVIYLSSKKLFSYEYGLGKDISCIKHLKKGDKDISPFDMFNINSKTIKRPEGEFIFKDASNVFDFVLKNVSFFDKCGFMKLLNEFSSSLELNAFLTLYLSLIYEYPVLELLIKMGHISLVEGIFNSLLSSSRKDEIVGKVVELEELIDKNTTKGSMVLRFPSYIGDYLIKQRASFRDYLFWRDIYEISKISKENFEKFISMPERAILNSEIGHEVSYYSSNDWYCLGIQEIIKYEGYTLDKVIRYIFQYKLKNFDMNRRVFNRFIFSNEITILKDTLRMAEELDFELEKYPDNLHQIHDQLSKAHRQRASEMEEKVVGDIARECTTVLDKVFSSGAADLPLKAMEKLTYVFPKTQLDFTQEGQNQHNCVAGYFSRVKSGECIIFFVRNKNKAGDSYITAEITLSGIAQVMYSNNRPVSHDSMDYKYCRYIANKILAAVKREEVLALHKIIKRK